MPSDKAVVHVIDDDEAMRESLAFLLATVGMEVQTYEMSHAISSAPRSGRGGRGPSDLRLARCRSARRPCRGISVPLYSGRPHHQHHG
jgi:FixJ family two-component response regulator